jgi:oligopeptide transport system substrate-binding protein
MDGDYIIKNDLFEGLVTFDAQGNIMPGVAHSWTVSPDNLTYVFKLRRESRWSNGDPVTAPDFVYAFRRLVAPENGCSASFFLNDFKNGASILRGEIKDATQLGVKALDDHTLEINLETPIPYLLDILASYGGYPLHEKTLKAHGNQWARPGVMVSNGPFMLKEWVPNDHVKIIKNPHFWDKKSVKLEAVYYLPVTDESTELKMFRTGKLDITFPNIQSPSMVEFMQRKGPEVVRMSPSLKMNIYVFSMKSPALRDKRVREALSLAVDRHLLTEKALVAGSATPAYSLALPGLNNTLKSHLEEAEMSREDQWARARQLYKEAGYSDKNPLVVNLIIPNKPSRRKAAIGVAGMVRQVLGAQINIEGKESKIYDSQVGQDVYDIYDLMWALDYNDALGLIEQFSGANGRLNAACYHNPQFEEILKKARQTGDREKRDQLLDEACQILFDDHVIMPLFFTKNYRFVHPRVKGFYENIINVHGSRYLSIDPGKADLTF